MTNTSNPIKQLLDKLPEDRSKVVIDKDFIQTVGKLLTLGGVRIVDNKTIDEFLWFLHKNNVVSLSYIESDDKRINFINRKI